MLYRLDPNRPTMGVIPEKRSVEATEAVKRSRKNKFTVPIQDCIGEGSSHPPSSSFVEIVPHATLEGLFVGNNNTLYTKNLVPGEAHNDEILLPVQIDDETEVEYREWNPSRSKLAAAILSGADNIWIKSGSRVLYLGDECGTTVSHISDLVGPEGMVYAVEFDNWKPLVNMAEKRFNIVPIIERPGCAWKYRMLVGMVDVMFSYVANLEQALMTSQNAKHFLKVGGHYVIYVKADCSGSTSRCEDVFACLGRKQRQFKPMGRLTLKPFDGDHVYVTGCYRMLEA